MGYGLNGTQILDAFEAQQAIAKSKDTNSVMNGWVDRGPWFYYDTLTAAAGATLQNSYQLFSVQVGGQNPLTSATKTIIETNMVRGNQFPPPRCLLLQCVGFYFSSTMRKADIDAVLDGGLLRLTIDEKVFHEGPLVYYPSGAGLAGTTTRTGESVYTLGIPSPMSTRRYGAWSKYIAPLQQFNVSVLFPATPTLLTTDAGGAGLRMQCTLDGLTDRSVQ
jgi:hypothetical protein